MSQAEAEADPVGLRDPEAKWSVKDGILQGMDRVRYQAGCAINCSECPMNRRWVVESAVMDLVAVSSAGATVSFGFFCTGLIIDGGF